VSKDSGLNGIDLGSIPFLNDWIKDSIRFGLAAYVTPRYVSIDLAALLHGYVALNFDDLNDHVCK